MISRHFRILVTTLLIATSAAVAGSQEKAKPITAPELVALVAGNALNENIVQEIESRGLAFRPGDGYRLQLSAAGADARVLAAVGKATISSPTGAAENKESSDLLQHLSLAGKLIRAKQYQQAAEELTGALQENGSVEAGFVMGELLREQQQWPMSASVYEEVLKRNPDFPEAHTKFSYLLYRLGDPERGLREAHIALARTPDNAEAHKNAALLLQNMRNFDAAVDEYKEALRLKPDYAVVRYDLGLLFYEK
jgi:tetratricopeptide (TPR) repeat protein